MEMVVAEDLDVSRTTYLFFLTPQMLSIRGSFVEVLDLLCKGRARRSCFIKCSFPSFGQVERFNYSTSLVAQAGDGRCFHSSDMKFASLFPSWFLGCGWSHSSALLVWLTDFFTGCLHLLEKASWAVRLFPTSTVPGASSFSSPILAPENLFNTYYLAGGTPTTVPVLLA